MRIRKEDANGDYQFGNSELDFYQDDPAGVGLKVKTNLLLWLGEWYLNTDDGTPYLQGILGKHSQADADTVLQDRVLNIEEVTGISSYSSTLNANARSFSVSISLDTLYGPTTVQVENYVNY